MLRPPGTARAQVGGRKCCLEQMPRMRSIIGRLREVVTQWTGKPLLCHHPHSLQQKGPAVGRGLWSACEPLGSVEGDQACHDAPSYDATIMQDRSACRCHVAQGQDGNPGASACLLPTASDLRHSDAAPEPGRRPMPDTRFSAVRRPRGSGSTRRKGATGPARRLSPFFIHAIASGPPSQLMGAWRRERFRAPSSLRFTLLSKRFPRACVRRVLSGLLVHDLC
jgi:hypothetical protein